MLSGTVQLFDGGDRYDATAGDFLHVPVGGVHAFCNASGERAGMLLLVAPGAPVTDAVEQVTRAPCGHAGAVPRRRRAGAARYLSRPLSGPRARPG